MSDVKEGWITWDAIPPQFNRYMELNIFHMVWAHPKVVGAFSGAHLSMTLVSSIGPSSGPASARDIRGWRILFPNVSTYRSTAIERWHGPMPQNETRRLLTSTWEVANSTWVRESLSEHVLKSNPTVRHFVVASSFYIVDIAAITWTTSALGPWNSEAEKLKDLWQIMMAPERDEREVD
jgi:hypothetical protein